jgi:N-acetylglucosamine malate deacetylase 1
MRKKDRVLVVVAHPDDEVLGCGGTIARLAQEDHECSLLILAEGVTSRDKERKVKEREKALSTLREETKKAADVLGFADIRTASFPDNRMDSVDFLDVVKVVENEIERKKPSIIFTHFSQDLNIDHVIAARAVATATRPGCGEDVPTVYSCEILSSTEWNFSLEKKPFAPNVFFDINGTLDLKKKALEMYASELRSFPHPRSVEAVENLAKVRGSQSGTLASEAFMLLRTIK